MSIVHLKLVHIILTRTAAIFAACMTIFLSDAYGADADSDKWYEVELIIFSHQENNVLQSENWVPDPGLPNLDKGVEHLIPVALEPPTGGATPLPASPKGSLIPFQILPSTDYRLSPLAEKLMASTNYRILTHLAWRQPVSKGERGTSVAIDSGVSDAAPAKASDAVSPLVGVVTLTSTRYLHLAMDFVYRDPEILRAASVLDSTTPVFAIGTEGSVPIEAKKNSAISGFRLVESRRIRLEQIHYYDHPLFGIIARVMSYEPPKPPKNP